VSYVAYVLQWSVTDDDDEQMPDSKTMLAPTLCDKWRRQKGQLQCWSQAPITWITHSRAWPRPIDIRNTGHEAQGST